MVGTTFYLKEFTWTDFLIRHKKVSNWQGSIEIIQFDNSHHHLVTEWNQGSRDNDKNQLAS